MSVYRKQFEDLIGPFQEWPALLCPSCRLAVLEPTIGVVESLASITGREGEPLGSSEQSGFFHGTLSCSRTPCRNVYVVAGEWSRSPEGIADFDNDTGPTGLEVRHILPALPLMDFPDSVPRTIIGLVDSASAVILSDTSAAATRIRAAIECLLDEQRIRKTSPSKRSVKLSTHERILLFRSIDSKAADLMMAMKWIGNIGTHESSPLPLSVVLDGTELFARAIELIYDRQAHALERLAANINRRGKRLRPKHLTKPAATDNRDLELNLRPFSFALWLISDSATAAIRRMRLVPTLVRRTPGLSRHLRCGRHRSHPRLSGPARRAGEL